MPPRCFLNLDLSPVERIESERSLVRMELDRSLELSRPEPLEFDRCLPEEPLSRPRRVELGWVSPMRVGRGSITGGLWEARQRFDRGQKMRWHIHSGGRDPAFCCCCAAVNFSFCVISRRRSRSKTRLEEANYGTSKHRFPHPMQEVQVDSLKFQFVVK